MLWHTTLKVSALIALCVQSSIAAPPKAEPNQAHQRPETKSQGEIDKPFIRLNTPLVAGEFMVIIEQLPDRDATRLILSGNMWDAAFEGEGIPSNAWDAKLVFVFSDHSSDIDSLGPLRTWQVGQTTELYSAESLAPDAALWTKKTAPQLGSIEVWNSDTQDQRLTDSAVVSLFHAMILPKQSDDQSPEGTTCNPTYEGCLGSANTHCKHGIGSFEYHCEEGSVTCKFTCLEPAPE